MRKLGLNDGSGLGCFQGFFRYNFTVTDKYEVYVQKGSGFGAGGDHLDSKRTGNNTIWRKPYLAWIP